ncbi:liver-expressed antimicrobial peptide 2 [Clarias gariepinus]|uniref:liver-expressed antimicrobial peptide 2 n=1 Tax=Clarias gariepinus TaxID=13013 RepID=UPI00234DD359|nr:liver-expressed antimicrobial peptide 2 [Clarias gariepinus]
MKEQSHFSRKAIAAWCLVFMVLIQQVTSSPVPEMKAASGSVQGVQRSLRRMARMTPLWRIMGTKPHGAYCQNNYECSTGICRKGHCSFSQPINS